MVLPSYEEEERRATCEEREEEKEDAEERKELEVVSLGRYDRGPSHEQNSVYDEISGF